jgi:hypothetical protein
MAAAVHNYGHWNGKQSRGSGLFFVNNANCAGRGIIDQNHMGRGSLSTQSLVKFSHFKPTLFRSCVVAGSGKDLQAQQFHTCVRMASGHQISKPQKLVVVGGGAAGFMSAIEAARGSKEASVDLDVVILEASARVLQKVKISGGGRCNVLHDETKGVKTISEGLLPIFYLALITIY